MEAPTVEDWSYGGRGHEGWRHVTSTIGNVAPPPEKQTNSSQLALRFLDPLKLKCILSVQHNTLAYCALSFVTTAALGARLNSLSSLKEQPCG